MKNIRKILIRDLIALFKAPLALLIAGGLCLLPALYAWFNIYSNWDPYANTGAVPIALACEDPGYTTDAGEEVNVAESVIDSLLETASINWIKVDSEAEARDGVTSGKYYAAIVFDENFTSSMYEGFLNGLERPRATYIENEKKNAIAIKITDTAVGNVENKINEQYISLVVSTLFNKGEKITTEIDSRDYIGRLVENVETMKTTVDDFSTMIKSISAANEKLSASLEGATGDLNAISANLGTVGEKITDVPDTNALASKLIAANATAVNAIGDSVDAIKTASGTDQANNKAKMYRQAAKHLQSAKNSVDTMSNSLQLLNSSSMNLSQSVVLTQLQATSVSLQANIDSCNEAADHAEASELMPETEAELAAQAKALQTNMQTVITQSMAQLGVELQNLSNSANTMIANVQSDIELIHMILGNGTQTIDLADESFTGIATRLDQISSELDDVVDVLYALSNAGLTEKFLAFMQGDPDAYGEFFAEPVHIVTESVYPVENYGSGMTPFYTTLAIWVGGVVLVSLIKTKSDKKGVETAKQYELYFGRYALFFILTMIQVVVIVIGNLYLLKIQCMYPGKFLLASLLTGLTFSLLIYTFTLSFGDIGKAFIVVIMVIQVAGSSGSYPIEILPEFYRKMYIFFPFPYAINAMREAIAGTYENDYVIYLLQLLIFAAAALVLGLFIRIPFAKLNHFVEERMEETHFM